MKMSPITKRQKKIVCSVVGIIVLYLTYTVAWNVGHSSVQPATTKPSSVVQPTISHPTGPTPAELFTDVNNERIKASLPPLVDDPALDASAIAKCSDMVDNDYKAHVSPAGVNWTSFFPTSYSQNYLIGENLSWNYPTSQKAVAGWMGSPEHKKNILDPRFKYVGYAVCGPDKAPGENDVVQHFRAG